MAISVTGSWYRDRNTVEPGDTVPDPVGQSAGVWTPVFHDHFNSGMAVTDAANGLVNFGGPTWQAWYPSLSVVDGGNVHWNNTTELQYYDTTAVATSGGLLQLTATHSTGYAGTPQSYVSGMLSSYPSFNFTYGYAEARILMPQATGTWPAFWLNSSDLTWPPETDIMEHTNADPSFTNTTWSTTGGGSSSYTVTGYDMTGWRVYGMKWAAGAISFYTDGVLSRTVTTAGMVPSKNMYVILNLAVNGTPNQAAYPQTMQVDYVRVWQ